MKTLEAHRRLRRLNALLSLTHDHAAELGAQLTQVLDNLFDLSVDECAESAVEDAADVLRRLYQGGENAAFSQLDLSVCAWGPLWVSEAVRQAMRPLVGYADAILLVTGLVDYVHPCGGHGPVCRADYAAMRTCIETQATAYLGKDARLRIFFI